jgi:hypothetical protein
LAGAVTLEPFIGDRRAGDIAAQVLQLLALIGAPAHCRMKSEADWSKHPKAKTADPKQFVDAGFVEKLDRQGFIDSLYK